MLTHLEAVQLFSAHCTQQLSSEYLPAYNDESISIVKLLLHIDTAVIVYDRSADASIYKPSNAVAAASGDQSTIFATAMVGKEGAEHIGM